MDFVRIPPPTMESEFYRILIAHGFPSDKARICAQVFMNNSLEGIYTHGVNRFPRFIEYKEKGFVKPDKIAVCKHQAGAIEQWDGQSGPGIVNALLCTEHATTIASQNGIGCVALANTNHWMRGGTYGWKAAKAGFVFIGWTNTIANMPAWGAVDNKLGNNPLVIAIPYQEDAIVLDMAMSQYSYGALEFSKLKGEELPVPGGFDSDGKLSYSPEKIIESKRTLPIGYWKGAGLSLLLDILSAVLSGGLSTAKISEQPAEYNLSQVFIAMDLSRLNNNKSITQAIQQIIDDYHESVPEKNSRNVRYPGERVLQTREENTRNGIPVLKNVWEEIMAL